MSVHIHAEEGSIAETVLLPGDPMRAKYIAENFFENAVCYNRVRGELGYTGEYKGHRISVQSTGMGMPSATIYTTELICDYGVNKLIRIGSIGGYQDEIKLRDIIVAQATCTDSNMNKIIFNDEISYAPVADFELLKTVDEKGKSLNIPVKIGNVLTTDTFYVWRHDKREQLVKHNVLGVEMEAAAIYTVAARYKKKALAMFTVSDHLVREEKLSPEERELSFNDMVKVALETAIA